MDWVEKIRQRLTHSFAHLPLPQAVRDALLTDELKAVVIATENGRPFGTAPRPGDTDYVSGAEGEVFVSEEEEEDDLLTSRGERFSELRRRARLEWEPDNPELKKN